MERKGATDRPPASPHALSSHGRPPAAVTPAYPSVPLWEDLGAERGPAKGGHAAVTGARPRRLGPLALSLPARSSVRLNPRLLRRGHSSRARGPHSLPFGSPWPLRCLEAAALWDHGPSSSVYPACRRRGVLREQDGGDVPHVCSWVHGFSDLNH